MKIEMDIDTEVLTEATALATREGTTLDAVIERALREIVARHHEQRRAPTTPRSNRRGGLRPGVNLDSNAALLDLLDDEDRMNRPGIYH